MAVLQSYSRDQRFLLPPDLADWVPEDDLAHFVIAPALVIWCGSLIQVSGRNSARPTAIGTSPRANVSDTNVWQLAVLPSVVAYCGATPTERLPFFGNAVSSMTKTASAPPTRRSASSSSARCSGPSFQIPAAMKWCSRS